jgi:hypothetical protein
VNNLPAKNPGNDTPDDILPVSSDPQSIWNQPAFPHKTKKTQFTPQQVKEALNEYAHSIEPIDKILDRRRIKCETFWSLARVYDEISGYYLHAQRMKARKYGESAQQLWDKLPDDPVFYQADREGNKCLTAAAVRYLEAKSQQYHRLAQIHETGSFIPLSKQETVNRNLSIGVQINGKLPDGFDLNNASPDQLIDLLRGRGNT